ncbi:MAG: leucine-rich repeat protein [Ruminiclostridium sp.]|nr:leucine-rich repeat protein [Ruminiclostridium sp.]
MKKKLALLLTAVLLLSSCGNNSESDKDAEISKLQEELAALQSTQESTSAAIQSNDTVVDTTVSENVVNDVSVSNKQAYGVDMIGKSLAEIEGVTLSYKQHYAQIALEVYVSDIIPLEMLTCFWGDNKDELIVVGVNVLSGGALTDKIYGGMTYSELKAADPENVEDLFVSPMNGGIYADITIDSVPNSTKWVQAEWDCSIDAAANTACSSLIYSDFGLREKVEANPVGYTANPYSDNYKLYPENGTSDSGASGNDTSGNSENSNISSNPVVALSDDMWEVLPYIDETPLEYLDYYYRDDINGIYVDAVIQRGITKVRLPAYIDGQPVIAVDFSGSEVKELILPDTVLAAAVNKEIIEYINFPKYTQFIDTDTYFQKKVLKGVYISSDRKSYIEESLQRFTHAAFMYNGKIYDSTSVWKIFRDEPLLGLDFHGSEVKVNSSVQEIVIPEGVTGPRNGFNFGFSIRKISLPSTTTRVNFSNCKALESVTIPEGVTELPQKCFDYCHSLSEVVLNLSIMLDTFSSIGKML